MIEFDENLRQGLPLIYECGCAIIICKDGIARKVNDDYLDKIIKEKE